VSNVGCSTGKREWQLPAHVVSIFVSNGKGHWEWEVVT
jgi:hypothetical protein